MGFNGLLLVNKPKGLTSHDVVAQARKILNTSEVGHTGTLDPIAEGLLVLTIGEATKLNLYLQEKNKAYRVTYRLGVKTDSFDITGKVLETKSVEVSSDHVLKTAAEISGEFHWPVPIFSATKVNGKKLYEYARQDVVIETPKKMMKFWDVQTQKLEETVYQTELSCSKGSFIRSWVSDLGERLGCGAVMEALVRTSTEPYRLESAVTLDELKSTIGDISSQKAFVPLSQAMPHVKTLRIKGIDKTLLQNGQISHDLRGLLIQKFNPKEDQIVQVHALDSKSLLAIIGLEQGKGFAIRRVFKY